MSNGQKRKRSLTRRDWVEAAQECLVTSGIGSVKIEYLASVLDATRGSFYWHFTDHADLLDELLATWVDRNTSPFRRIFANTADEPLMQLLGYCLVWLHDEFDPDYDSAVRDWGRSSDTVAETVRRVDDERIDILLSLFERTGYEATEALVRARAFYYHQVGYYALKVVQPREERLQLFPVYFRVLSGFPMPPVSLEKHLADGCGMKDEEVIQAE